MQQPDPAPRPRRKLDLKAIGSDAAPSKAAFQAANKEVDVFEQDKRAGAHRRDQRSRNTVNIAVVVLVCVAAFVACCGMLAWTWHALAATRLCWLETERLKTLEHLGQIAVGGALGGLLVKFLTKNIEP